MTSEGAGDREMRCRASRGGTVSTPSLATPARSHKIVRTLRERLPPRLWQHSPRLLHARALPLAAAMIADAEPSKCGPTAAASRSREPVYV